MDNNGSVENDHIKFWIEDEFINGCYKKNCILSLKAAKEVVEMRLKFQNGKIYKGFLLYVTHLKALTPEAKEYLSKEGCEGIENAALISSSFFTNILGNLFITINKPIIPTKLFSNKEDALKWLKNR